MKYLDKALIGAGAALLLSGGIATAAIGPTNFGSTVLSALPGDLTVNASDHGIGGANFLSAAAAYIGISEADLRAQLQSGKSLADVAVANGKTRDGLIVALTQAAATQIGTLVDQKGGFPAGGPGFGMRGGDELAAASTYLGISEQDLHTKLQSGQTLAQIAGATAGKSRDGLIQALVNAETAKIDQAVKDGKLTADQAAQMKTNLAQRITQMVDATRPAGGPGHVRSGHGFPGFPGGPRPSGSPAPSQTP